MNDQRALLLDRIVAPRPDPEAWRALVASCQAEHGSRADLALTALLGRKLARIDREARETLLPAVAEVVAGKEANGLARLLASDAEEGARHLALEMVARWQGALPAELLPSLRGLFLDRRLPESAQLAAAATLLRSLEKDPATAEEFLRTLVSGLGKVRSINRLRKLEERVGKTPRIEALCERLEEKIRMSCPRCEVELRRPDMVRHLWEEHKLLLVGRRVREPWSLVEEWIDARKAGGPAELLGRCRNLAQHLDADQGLLKVNREILTRGVDDAEARQFLLEEAAEQHASLCPRCFSTIPMPPEVKPWVLTQRQGRLAARGFLVDVSDRTLRTRLEVRTPARALFVGPEPHYLLTLRGSLFFLVGPLVLLALVCAVGVVEFARSPLSPVVWFLSLALLVYGCVRWDLRERPSPARRAMTYAWTVLAPRLHDGQFCLEDASFLAALTDLEGGDEDVRQRAAVMPRLIQVTADALGRGEGAPFHLAALCLRQVADNALNGANPEAEIARLVGRCFEGKLPLAFADCLLSGWRRDWGTAGRAVRLRILVCDLAFEAGFEVRPLLDAGQTAPVLGEVLGVNRPGELAALRLLWSLRPSRPWDRCGPALTVFELAADPVYEARLTEIPDLLFYQTDPSWPPELDDDDVEAPFRIVVRVKGLMVQDHLLEEAPAAVRLKGRLDASELILGSKRFRSEGPLEKVADRVEQWVWFYFTQFRPKLADVMEWQAPEKAALWRAWGAVACPECGKPALPRLGEMAVALGREGRSRPAEAGR